MINLQTLGRPMVIPGFNHMPPTPFLTTLMPTIRRRSAIPDPLNRPSPSTQIPIPECGFCNGFFSNFPSLSWVHRLFVQVR
ncbi:hypothetical protein Hanom_Chr05g00474171 [Helianthus anomalus]